MQGVGERIDIPFGAAGQGLEGSSRCRLRRLLWSGGPEWRLVRHCFPAVFSGMADNKLSRWYAAAALLPAQASEHRKA